MHQQKEHPPVMVSDERVNKKRPEKHGLLMLLREVILKRLSPNENIIAHIYLIKNRPNIEFVLNKAILNE